MSDQSPDTASTAEREEQHPDTTPTLSAVETTKRESNLLRGGLREAAVSSATHFTESDATLLKFHGVYQQDDRDQRVKRGEPTEKAWRMMVRLTIPGGVLTADQYLDLDRLADRAGNGTLRFTTRQSVQFHGILKGNLKPLLAALNESLLTTIAACGDVSRNVMATPTPIDDEAHRTVQTVARDIARELRPQTGAYYEIWLDGERASDSREHEPVYGETYLPRKFKVGVGLDTDNSIDAYSYDCSLLAITDGSRATGFNLLVGGGFGITHNKANTFARIATPLAFIPTSRAVETVRAVCELYRDHGNRSDRKRARIKYLLESWGDTRFVAELQQRLSFVLQPAVPAPTQLPHDYLGAHAQGDGKWFYGVFVQSGRVADTTHVRLRAALREIVHTLRPGVRLTPTQGVLFTDLSESAVTILEQILGKHRVASVESLNEIVRHSMACPAMPTCGLALAESERALPDVLRALQQQFDGAGVNDVPVTVRMTGCPNGCARPYNADIGLVGRRPGVYNVYVGGSLRGDRLADLFASDVKVGDITNALVPLVALYASTRQAGEAFGDFYQRTASSRMTDRPAHRRLLTGQERPTLPLLALSTA